MKGKLKWLSLLFAISSATAHADAAGEGDIYSQIKTPFAAYLMLTNERSGMRERQAVVLSSFGVRLKGKGLFGGSGDGMFITNFDRKVSWIIDLEKRIYAEVPEEIGESESIGGQSSGIMSTQPCMDAGEKRVGREAGSRLERHQCDYDGAIVKQYFDNEFGVVVKEVYPNGDIFQLANMRAVSFPPEFFTPPDNYKKVDVQEFYMGLATYDRQATTE